MNPYQELCHFKGRSPSPLQYFRCAFKALSFNRGASPVALVVKNPPVNAGDLRALGSVPGWEDLLEEGMATHSSSLAWRIPWTEEPGGL